MAFEKKYGSRAEVWHGKAEMTEGMLKKKDLVMGNDGQIKSKKMVKRGQDPALKKWRKAVEQARKNLGVEKGEMALVKGKLRAEADKIYKKM